MESLPRDREGAGSLPRASFDQRVLILSLSGADAELLSEILQDAAIDCYTCLKAEEIIAAAKEGAGALLLSEEVLESDLLRQLRSLLEKQPPWSDLPVIISTFEHSINKLNTTLAVEALRNVTFLERPLRIMTLVSVIRNSLAARQRQYEIRDLLAKERAARLAIEHASRIKDEFLATLSHELRTPLNAILGFAELLPYEDPDSPEFQDAISHISRNARIQSQLIDDILDISKIITGKLDLDVKPVDVKKILLEVSKNFQCAARAKGLRLHLILPAIESMIAGDSFRLRQVIWNLLSNAIKFTPEHGHIWIALREHNEHLNLIVADSGKGIDIEFLPFVFDRFRQQDSTYSRAFGGLGLGLSIVRHLVEAHGGEVQAHSEGKGRGAAFTITLPLLQQDHPFNHLSQNSRDAFSELSLH